MAGQFSLRPNSSSHSHAHSSSSHTLASRLLFLLTLLPLTLACFAFLLQWRGGLNDPVTRWSPDQHEFPGMSTTAPSFSSHSSHSDCVDLLGRSHSPAFSYYRDWKFDYGTDLKPKVTISSFILITFHALDLLCFAAYLISRDFGVWMCVWPQNFSNLVKVADLFLGRWIDFDCLLDLIQCLSIWMAILFDSDECLLYIYEFRLTVACDGDDMLRKWNLFRIWILYVIFLVFWLGLCNILALLVWQRWGKRFSRFCCWCTQTAMYNLSLWNLVLIRYALQQALLLV